MGDGCEQAANVLVVLAMIEKLGVCKGTSHIQFSTLYLPLFTKFFLPFYCHHIWMYLAI
jgi:hypothetical protein